MTKAKFQGWQFNKKSNDKMQTTTIILKDDSSLFARLLIVCP